MTDTNTVPLFGLQLVNAKMATAINALLDRPGRTTAAFVNAHCVNVAARDKLYMRALRAADFLLPDGSGLSLAARLSGRKFAANLNGTDLCLPFCAEAAKRGLSVFLLGARPGVAETATQNMCDRTPGLEIAGFRDGFFDEAETEDVIAQINDSGADILLVARGVPLQDTWLYRHRTQIRAQLVMGVGALFDFEAGEVSRAPSALRRLGLEWTWRLAIEPRRMAHRYLVGNPVFIARSVANALRQSPAKRTAMSPAKRLLDISVATLALLAVSPILAATAVAVKATSRGPVFFRQERVGHDGKHFTMLKFRSMHVDAEERRAEVLEQSEREGVCFKMQNDPRLTPIGRFIRRYSIDELPQIINVLGGAMSLVGPRPALPSEVAAYPPHALRRLDAVPGITGLWQVSGRADVGFDRMLAMDVAYNRSKSVYLDLILLFLTVRAVVSARGAY